LPKLFHPRLVIEFGKFAKSKFKLVHPINAFCKNVVKLEVLEKSIDVNDVQLANPPSSVIVDGRVTDVISVRLNALQVLPESRLEQVVIPSGKTRFVI